MIEEVMGANAGRFIVAVIGVGLALLCLVGILWIVRGRRGPSPFVRGGRNRQPRLQVLDAAAVDARRRLVLVRRDDVEHLIMIGGPTDVVIESRIAASPLPLDTRTPETAPASNAAAAGAGPRAPQPRPISQPSVPRPDQARDATLPAPARPAASTAASPPASPVSPSPAPVTTAHRPVAAATAPAARAEAAAPVAIAPPVSIATAASPQRDARVNAVAPSAPALDDAARLLDTARDRVFADGRPGADNPLPPAPIAATRLPAGDERRTIGSDFEKILEEEMENNLAARTAVPAAAPTPVFAPKGAAVPAPEPTRTDPTLQSEVGPMRLARSDWPGQTGLCWLLLTRLRVSPIRPDKPFPAVRGALAPRWTRMIDPPPFRIYLMRHARAGWAAPGEKDFDRALDGRGFAEAEWVADRAADRGYAPDCVISSTAARCRQTAEALRKAIDETLEILFVDELYNGTAETYATVIAAQAQSRSVMLVGHNPTMEELLAQLIGDAACRASMPDGYPTAGIAVLDHRHRDGGDADWNPTIRLGVTGLSRAGKTVLISSIVHNLLNGGRLPLVEAMRSGRISATRLEQQPDDAVPRFQYEDHIQALVHERVWPDSTRAVSELRLTIEYQSASGWNRIFSPGRLSLDIVDYPGEWLLDLPLLAQDFRQFSQATADLAQTGIRKELAAEWMELAKSVDMDAPGDEMTAKRLFDAFSGYLRACKSDERSLSTLPPGRFLMPGDLEGSPALTFAPLPGIPEGEAPKGSLRAMMERRYEAYKSLVIKPFFRHHFARLDRQIVLVDALQAINRGPEAVQDLERALSDVLSCFRPGHNSFFSSIVGRRIDKVLIAATKADHLHHESHDRLERLTSRLVDRAIQRIGMSGAGIEVMAIASVRATREAQVKQAGHLLPVIVGTPIAGERINGELFDGTRATAIFPGDLPEDPERLFQSLDSDNPDLPDINFVRFRPPSLEAPRRQTHLAVPHIRLDRALHPQSFDGAVVLTADEDDPFLGSPDAASLPVAAPQPRRRFSFAGLAAAALGTFLSLAFGLWADGVIRSLFARADWLGYAAVTALVIALLGVMAVVAREMIGIARLSAVQAVKTEAEEAAASVFPAPARKVVERLDALLGHRPETARGRAVLAATKDDIIDGPHLLELAERELLIPLDRRARSLILNASKRVAVVTAVSPRAVVDLAYVLFEVSRLIRGLAEIYGARPGKLGLLRLIRDVVAHLAVTGSIAVGDGIAQQVLGHGLASRLSRRLGEGVVNGLLTARIGIAAMDLCRPLPFKALPRPGMGDFLADIVAVGNRREPE
eukprot:g7766.t1